MPLTLFRQKHKKASLYTTVFSSLSIVIKKVSERFKTLIYHVALHVSFILLHFSFIPRNRMILIHTSTTLKIFILPSPSSCLLYNTNSHLFLSSQIRCAHWQWRKSYFLKLTRAYGWEILRMHVFLNDISKFLFKNFSSVFGILNLDFFTLSIIILISF